MKLKIRTIGDPVLRKKCEEWDLSKPIPKDFIDAMWHTMYTLDGLGLAAPQVGKSICVFVLDTQSLFESMKSHQRKKYFGTEQGIKSVFINPVITFKSEHTTIDEEGCLSIPDKWFDVERSEFITVDYYDEHLQFYSRNFEGYNARFIQHEVDHLDGILID